MSTAPHIMPAGYFIYSYNGGPITLVEMFQLYPNGTVKRILGGSNNSGA